MTAPTWLRAARPLALGSAWGAAEVAVRVEPRMGLDAAAVASWLAISVGLAVAIAALGAALSALVARAARAGDRVEAALLAGGVLTIVLAFNYRFEVVLNELVRDPRVWGGMSALAVVGLALGALVAPVLGRPRVLGGLALVGVALAAVAFVRAAAPRPTPGQGPSFLIITLDTVRPDRLSPYGHDNDTPALARLAREGVTFTQAVAAAPITEPSHLAMFTGVPPIGSGVVSNGTRLGDRPLLVWRALRERGWSTAAWVSGFPLHGKYGWTQGMDIYDDDFGDVAGVQHLTIVKAWNQVALEAHALRERSADRVLARAVPWLERNRDARFFAWVHLYDAHAPYESPYNVDLPPPPTEGARLTSLPAFWPAQWRAVTSVAWLAQAYDAELRWVDHAVGRLVDALGPRLDDTVVVVLADHGESLGEHEYWFDHGDNLYDPSLRIPFLVRAPGRAVAGLRPGCQVGAVDLAPTVLALAGVDDAQTREGRSLTDVLAGGPCVELPVFASTIAGRHMDDPPTDHALRGKGHKLIVHDDDSTELYDLDADPHERANLGPTPLSEQMTAAVRARRDASAVASPEMDADTLHALEALGYLERR